MDEEIADSFESIEKLIDQRTWALRQMIEAQNKLIISLAFHIATSVAPDYSDQLHKRMDDAKQTWIGKGYLYEDEK